MTGGPTAVHGAPRFPALDPEPPPMSLGRRLLVAGIWLAAIGALVGAGFGISALVTPGHATPATTSGLPSGLLVVVTPDHQLGLVSLNRNTERTIKALGVFQQGPPAPSSDGRFLVAPDGTLIAMSRSGLARAPAQFSLDTRAQEPPHGDALADGDQALVVFTLTPPGPLTEPADIPVIHATLILRSGRATDLGRADSAAGDPTSPGLFASVPAPSPAPGSTAATSGPQDDVRVELRDVGQPAVVLASAAELNRAVGLPAGDAVSLVPLPDPTGDRIAVTVSPDAGGRNEGIVLLNRAGRVMDSLPAAQGPPSGFSVSWSPDATALAFPATELGTAGIEVWTFGKGFLWQSDPVAAALPGDCLWAPDGSALICEVLGPGDQPDWIIAGPGGNPTRVLPAPGQLVAWLPLAGHP